MFILGIIYHKSNLVYASFIPQFLIFQKNISAQTSLLLFFTYKSLRKLNCSYGKVSLNLTSKFKFNLKFLHLNLTFIIYFSPRNCWFRFCSDTLVVIKIQFWIAMLRASEDISQKETSDRACSVASGCTRMRKLLINAYRRFQGNSTIKRDRVHLDQIDFVIDILQRKRYWLIHGSVVFKTIQICPFTVID